MKKPRHRHREVPYKGFRVNRRLRRRMNLDLGPSEHIRAWFDFRQTKLYENNFVNNFEKHRARYLRVIEGPMPVNAYSQNLRGMSCLLDRMDWMAARAVKQHSPFNDHTVEITINCGRDARLYLDRVWLYSDDLWITPESILLADRLRHFTRCHTRSFLDFFPIIEEKVGAPVLAYRLVRLRRGSNGHAVDLEVAFADEIDAMMAKLSA